MTRPSAAKCPANTIRCVRAGGVATAALLLTVLACASAPIVETAVLRPDVDFASLRSFAIVSAEDQQGQTHRDIEDAIRAALTERGLASLDIDRADMVVAYRASAVDRQKRKMSSDPDANSYRIVDYVEGTLVIDVFSRHVASRIWHGQAIVDEANREKLRARKVDAVEAVLGELPLGD